MHCKKMMKFLRKENEQMQKKSDTDIPSIIHRSAIATIIDIAITVAIAVCITVAITVCIAVPILIHHTSTSAGVITR